MKLLSYGEQGNERLGLMISENEFVDVNYLDNSISSNILDVISKDDFLKIEKLLRQFEFKKEFIININDVKISAPIPRPGLIVCVGLNYKDHADEQGCRYPEKPLLFSKASVSVCSYCENIKYPKNVSKLDYEVELGVVIGKKAQNIKKSDALEYVSGYLTFNDVSARCAQFGDRQWFRGKSFDNFAPMGPYMITKDEVRDPNNLGLKCFVNGELRQSSNTNNMIHNIESLISYISENVTLMPGDIIAIGTPAGVGAFMNPPELLEIGDVVKLEVEGLGQITNEIIS